MSPSCQQTGMYGNKNPFSAFHQETKLFSRPKLVFYLGLDAVVRNQHLNPRDWWVGCMNRKFLLGKAPNTQC